MREGREDFTQSIASQNTPLMADGRLYISSALGTVAALDATTGEVLWFDTPPDRDGEPFTRVRQTRGVAYWEDSGATTPACSRWSARTWWPSTPAPASATPTSATAARWI